GYLGDSFGLFPFVHGDSLANQFDGPFLVRLIRKEVTHISGFPFGIESRDPDIPSCWHSATMRRSCCWSIPCHNQANPLPTNDTPASDIPQRFQCPAMLGDGGVGNRKVRYRSARIPSPPSRGERSLYGKSPAQSEQLYCWIGRRRIISAENRGNSCHASILPRSWHEARAAPPTVAARTRIVSAAGIRLDHRNLCDLSKAYFATAFLSSSLTWPASQSS